MGKRYEARVEELKALKKPEEKIECIVNIDSRPYILRELRGAYAHKYSFDGNDGGCCKSYHRHSGGLS